MTRKYTHHKEEKPEPITISLGKVSDDYEALQRMCNDKSIELLKTMELKIGETKDVSFWTEGGGFPELIAVSHFYKDENGNVMFSLDDSETTL